MLVLGGEQHRIAGNTPWISEDARNLSASGQFLNRAGEARRMTSALPLNPMEVVMTRWMLGAATAMLICASSTAALADQAGAVTGGVAGAVGGAVVGGPVGAIVGGVGGAAIGNSMTHHRHYYHHHYAYYHHHHPYDRY